jgi:hypothetical protein
VGSVRSFKALMLLEPSPVDQPSTAVILMAVIRENRPVYFLLQGSTERVGYIIGQHVSLAVSVVTLSLGCEAAEAVSSANPNNV